MTSPPRRPIISLKFKTPDAAAGNTGVPAPAKPIVQPTPAPSRSKTEYVFKTPAPKAPPPTKTPVAKAAPPAPKKPEPAEAKPSKARKGPAISPDLFKTAIRSAGLAIQNVVQDPEWKSEELLHQYQAAKEHATSSHKQQAKLVSTVATRRHSRDIEQADVENAAMRAAYAAALVALVAGPEASEETPAAEP